MGEHVIGWILVKDLYLFGDWVMEWEAFTTSLTMAGIKIHDCSDIIFWCLNKQQVNVSALLEYKALVE